MKRSWLMIAFLMLTVLAIRPTNALAWGGAHVGYTHVGPNGAYHAGYTRGYGGNDAYHAGYTTGGYHYGTTSGGYYGAPGYHPPVATPYYTPSGGQGYTYAPAYGASYSYIR